MQSSLELRGTSVVLLGVVVAMVQGVTQMCNPQLSKVVHQFSVETCPFGVLFAIPLKADCLRSSSDNDMTTFFADVCQNIKYDPDASKQIQFITTLTDGPLSELDSCMGNQTFQCDVELKQVNGTEITAPGEDAILIAEANFDEPEDVATLRNDSAIVDQTMRMFKFLVGLEGDGNIGNKMEEVVNNKSGSAVIDGPILRLTELLTQSFKVLSKHCNVSYVAADFGRDMRRMFLFLLREGTIGRLEDVSREDYQRIKLALNHCMEQQSPFAVKGPACATYANARFVEKNGLTMAYQPDEYSYVPYKYEVVIDATWGVTDFTHGLCYGTFREHINSHHLYQRAMERLFIDPIVYRWSRPPRLNKEEIWDQLLSANTRQTMRNLDVCIQAAYFDIPFTHRLERPLVHYAGGPTPSPGSEGSSAPAPPPASAPVDSAPPAARRKRQAVTAEKSMKNKAKTKTKKKVDVDVDKEEGIKIDLANTDSVNGVAEGVDGDVVVDAEKDPEEKTNLTNTNSANAKLSLDEVGLSEAGWCFQNEAEQRTTVINYIRTTCPGSPALEQFSVVSSNSTTEEEAVWDYKDDEVGENLGNDSSVTTVGVDVVSKSSQGATTPIPTNAN